MVLSEGREGSDPEMGSCLRKDDDVIHSDHVAGLTHLAFLK